MLGALLTAATTQGSGNPFASFGAFLEKSPKLEVVYTFRRAPSGPASRIKLVIDRAGSLRLDSFDGTYKLIRQGDYGVELDFVGKEWADTRANPQNLFEIEPIITDGATDLLPMLLAKPAEMVKDGATFKQQGQLWVSDRQAGDASFTAKVTFGPNGFPKTYSLLIKGPTGSRYSEFTFESFKANPVLSPTWNDLLIPDGLSPYEVPRGIDTIQYESKPKWGSWPKASGGSVNLDDEVAKGKTLLLAVDPDLASTPELVLKLAELKKTLGGKAALQILVRTTDASAASAIASDALVEAPDRTLDSLKFSGYPSLVMVNSDGTILRMWSGFSPELWASHLREITQVLENGEIEQ
jgi:hypothetical protein